MSSIHFAESASIAEKYLAPSISASGIFRTHVIVYSKYYVSSRGLNVGVNAIFVIR